MKPWLILAIFAWCSASFAAAQPIVFQGTSAAPNGISVFNLVPPSMTQAPESTIPSLKVQISVPTLPSGVTTSSVQTTIQNENGLILVDTQLIGAGSKNVSGCIPSVPASNANYTVVVIGTVGVAFIVTVNFPPAALEVNGATLTGITDLTVTNIYYVDITDSASQWPLDIIVGSLDASSIGTLMVSSPWSPGCAFGGLNSVRLTFSKQGRFVLSPASSPAISNGRWYIGVTLSTASPVTSPTKVYTISVAAQTQFSGLFPGWQLFVLPIAVALATLVISHMVPACLFDGENKGFNTWLHSWSGIPNPKNIEWSPTLQTRYISWCTAVMDGGFIPFSFSWQTFFVSGILSIIVWQVVLASHNLMETTGNRDLCFYNNNCFNPISNWDVPFNNVISNIGYVVLGFAFNVNVAIYQFRGQVTGDCSLFYALGWGLAAEGVFSAMYHVCPSITSLQFDTIFMFILGGLLCLSVYQQGAESYKFKSAKFYAFFMFPLLIFNYVGTLTNTTDMSTSGVVAFVFLILTWELAVLVYIYIEFEEPTSHVARPIPHKFFGRTLCCGSVGYALFSAFVISCTVSAIVLDWDVASSLAGLLLLAAILSIVRMGYRRVVRSGKRLALFWILLALTLGCWAYAIYFFEQPWVRISLRRHSGL